MLIAHWKDGDSTALATLIPLIYNELHQLAAHYLRSERRGHTLQTTALVNEARGFRRLDIFPPGDGLREQRPR